MICIAIDGPSGSGKGALANGLAEKLHILHLDTGAIFRGIAVGFSKLGFFNPTEEEVEQNISKLNVEVVYNGEKQQILLNGENISAILRTEEISRLSSKLSALSVVREKYLAIVRDFVSKNDCIIDGRDITSVVVPNATVKFYLTADDSVRARRRYDENISKNIPCTLEEVAKNLRERDYRDSHRDIAPLIIVPGAIIVDNTNLTIDETINLCLNIINETINKGE